MRKQIALSIELMKFERYMATESIIKPSELKRKLHKLIEKAIQLETKN